MSHVVGIDFGTTNSSIAYVEASRPVIIPNTRGNRLTPSIVTYLKDRVLVGEPAKSQQIVNAERTISMIKRYMGKDYIFEINGRKLHPVEIAAMIFKKLKEDAEEYLGESLAHCVVSVPAYYSDRQRQDIKLAAESCGFKVERMINEPTAACLAYGIHKNESGYVMVFDIGGCLLYTSPSPRD